MEQVIFLKDNGENTVFAFFTEPEYGEYICFDPIGGHSECNLKYASECVQATKDEYLPIYRQLTVNYGYDLQIVEKSFFDWDLELWYHGYYLHQG